MNRIRTNFIVQKILKKCTGHNLEWCEICEYKLVEKSEHEAGRRGGGECNANAADEKKLRDDKTNKLKIDDTAPREQSISKAL